jgi:hypothetical protein
MGYPFAAAIQAVAGKMMLPPDLVAHPAGKAVIARLQ